MSAPNPLKVPVFAGARWVWWGLLLMPSVITTVTVCDPTPALWAAWAVALVLLCLWEAHVRALAAGLVGRALLGRWALRFVRVGLMTVCWTVIVSLPLVMLLPAYSCYTGRARMMELLVLASPLKQAIEDRAVERKTLTDAGEGLVWSPLPRGGRGLVGRDGTLVLLSQDPLGAVVLVPQWSAAEAKVQWHCDGVPAKNMPAECRHPAPDNAAAAGARP